MKEDVITTGRHYNYGVPSNKAKSSPSKRVSGSSSMGSKIRVCVRKRPQGQAEVASGEVDVVKVTARDMVTVTAPKIAVDLTKYTQKVLKEKSFFLPNHLLLRYWACTVV